MPATKKARVQSAKQDERRVDLGARVRRLRQAKNWTLEQLAARTRLARSTLSKIENGQTSPTFDVLQKIAAGLDLEVSALVRRDPALAASGRRSITRANQGQRVDISNYQHEFLCTEVAHRRFTMIRTRVIARSRTDFPEWVRHSGEESIFILEGEIEFHSEFYEPTRLKAGDAMHYDSGMGHALISTSPKDALVLWVSAA